MQDYKLKISKDVSPKDLTIIYKDSMHSLHKLKASKDDILRSLQYFRNKINEINQLHMIYIEENIPFDLFKSFISSITTEEIVINDSNYEKFYYLSCKYEYESLRKEIEHFITTRPDIHSIFDQMKEKCEQTYQIEPDKEELIAKNLDFSIKTGLLNKIPLEILNRILNSPYCQINDHHLLFSFVTSLLKTFSNEGKKIDEKTEANLSILTSSLDYTKMSSDEIEEFFKICQINNIFGPKKADEKIQMFISEEKEMKKEISKLEEKITQNKNQYEEKIKNLEERLNSNENEYKNIIANFETKIEQAQKNYEQIINEKVTSQFLLFEKNSKESNEKINSIQNDINSIKTEIEKINKQEESFESETKNMIQQNLLKIENKINEEKNNCNNKSTDVEKRLDLIEKQLKEITKINESQKSTQQNSIINIKYEGNELDGICSYIKKTKGENCVENGDLKISAGKTRAGSLNNLIKYDKDHINEYFSNHADSKFNESEGWIEFDFVKQKINLTSYTLRTIGLYYPKSWKVLGSNDRLNWAVLDRQIDNPALNGLYKQKRFECESNNNNYQYIRYIQDDSWFSNRQYCIELTCIEFFGSILTK